MSARPLTASLLAEAPASVESRSFSVDEPEEVVIHLVYDDDAEALAWGSVPGGALCGFVFTTTNTEAISNASLVLAEDCAACHARHAVMNAVYGYYFDGAETG